ncbi:MAG TPA: undecaprenyl-diphosphate phosphatase [Rhodospirillales bacterium]|nr:undecaprenyl-diphosphate phosphatase [Rhodospirillales bacterium]
MPLLQMLTLAAVQGITEFLPVSSSAHLILVPKLTGWPDQGLLIDVAVHVGTLLAVILYFWKDNLAMISAIFQSFQQLPNRNPLNPEFWLMIKLVLATIPVLIAGYIINRYLGNAFRSLEVIGWTTLCFALLLLIADKLSMTIREINHITFKGAIVIGLFQILALIPGTSRAGITMTAARFQGIGRRDAARFSLLLSIPVIFAAGCLKSFDLYILGNQAYFKEALVIAVLSFGFAMTAISLMMFWLRNFSYTPFVVYRIALGATLLFITYKIPHFQF